jgi:hypothetical protein
MSQKQALVDGYEMVFAFDGEEVGKGSCIGLGRALCT